ncbi:DUF3135 domain-containing protein [Noviherbaspirillum denitrificans]|uniref:DUF3135 domain-containing protein n=1 Tax=Noviherbaspirillum denitrificans TaxID=1968433 RepID=A0A254TRQ0_9BURK|nr:DUF3135 domain-containing protein [Noviherbaspirillum denitrificans]OWW22398.1 hypothetical protein AYR66_25790 [Noviherbaspirillum denitrificans]
MPSPLPDFDVLVALYRHDPAALEDFRRHMLREAVDEAPLHHRPALERLLEQIETARAHAATPVEAAAIAFRMMQESVGRLHNSWEQALEAAAGLQAALLIERLRLGSTLRAI